MLIKESQYSNALQKYDKKLVDAIVEQEPRLSQRFLLKMCDCVYSEKLLFNEVRDVFAKIQDGNLMIPNINSLDYSSLKELVNELYKSSQEDKLLFDNPFWVSPDKSIEIYLIHNYEDVKRLPFQNSWCIKDEGDYKYHAQDKSTTMYLIVNKRCSIRSNIRFVMAEVYPENEVDPEQTIFWATDNEILRGSKLNEYLMSLGDGANKIQLIPESINRNIYKYNQNNCNRNMKNKKVVRLTESQLHNIIAESVKRVLRENEFEKKYDTARLQAAQRGKIWGMEMKNPQKEWEYGNIEFNPNTMEMSCMGATIQVEEDWDVDDALEQLSYKLYELGYGDEE